jgi:drug/metabolite transporter (DMT)-like permease
MSHGALLLVLLAAVAHAAWNLLAKQSGGGAGFVWLGGVASVVIWAPLALAIILAGESGYGLAAVGFTLVSGCLHCAYFVLLQSGYRSGDLSLVYPLARGTGPLLATVAAIVILGERPSALGLLGGLAIVVAILSLAGSPRRLVATQAHVAAAYALATGVLIAIYTLWDREAVTTIGASPVVYNWGTMAVIAVLLAPRGLSQPDELRRLWHTQRRAVLGVGVLSPLAYVLVLFALRLTAVAYVAPAREVSVLLGAAMGVSVLGEPDARRRLLAAAGIVVGILALALG